MSCSKISQRKANLFAILFDITTNYEKKLAIPIPPKFKVIRWGAVGAVIRYVVKYREQLKALNNPDINEAIVVFRRPQVILVVRKVLQTLLRSQKYLQMTGPLDVFFMPCQILSVMRELREIKNSVLSYGMPLEFSASLCSFLEFFIVRLHRRFFFGDLIFATSTRDGDRSRKFNFFKNIYVLVAFALSPVHKFRFLQRWNLITEPKRKELEEHAKTALSIVARGLNSLGTI